MEQCNSVTVVTSKEALAELINTNFAKGVTTFTIRYEPANGSVQMPYANYAYSYTYPEYYNNDKCALITIQPQQ